MATKNELKQTIQDIKEGLESPYTPDQFKGDLKKELAAAEKQLADLEKAEKESAKSPKDEKKEAKAKEKTALQKAKERVKKSKTVVKKAEKKQEEAKKEEKKPTALTRIKTKKAAKSSKPAPKKRGRKPVNERDASRKALKGGRRVSKEGNVYYEYRENRSDSQRKRYPYLEDGGTTDFTNDGAGMFAGGGIFGGNKNVSRDRMFKSQEDWEQRYKRKTSPKNPRYKKYEQGGFTDFTNDGAGMFAGGGGIYSSHKLYILKVFSPNGDLLDMSKRLWARNIREAKTEAIDLYEYDMKQKYGDHLHFSVEEAPSMFANGGTTDFTNDGAGMFAMGGEMHKSEYADGGAIIDDTQGLLSDPRFDVESAMFKGGGKVSKKYNYLSKWDIGTIITNDGTVIDGSDVIDGLYVNKRVKF